MRREAMDPLLARGALLALLLAFAAIRVVYERDWKPAARSGVHDRREHALTVGVGLSQLVPASLWITGDKLDFANVALPAALQWTGLVLTAIGVALFLWVHRTLGRNFSPRLDMRQDHTLVVAGPYRWVRHPMYTTNVLLVVGYALLSANWVMLVVPGVMIALLLVIRLPDEEAMMAERFGDDWRAWAQTTGRLLPRIPSG